VDVTVPDFFFFLPAAKSSSAPQFFMVDISAPCELGKRPAMHHWETFLPLLSLACQQNFLARNMKITFSICFLVGRRSGGAESGGLMVCGGFRSK